MIIFQLNDARTSYIMMHNCGFLEPFTDNKKSFLEQIERATKEKTWIKLSHPILVFSPLELAQITIAVNQLTGGLCHDLGMGHMLESIPLLLQPLLKYKNLWIRHIPVDELGVPTSVPYEKAKHFAIVIERIP
jgi:hypothetical protein